MGCSRNPAFSATIGHLLLLTATATGVSDDRGLLQCLTTNGVKNFTSSQYSHQFYKLLNFSLQNLRFADPGVPKPYAIIIPQSKREVQQAVICCRRGEWEIRVRSGGHSYEGISSAAEAPNFVIIDLMNLNSVSVHVPSKTAWVQAGATLGETYYRIAQSIGGYGFSAGSCPTVGSGGHISGGGFGLLSRKYGLAADNVVDAHLVDSGGSLLNRKSMGEDLFWALRGGGGGSWGVVVAWRIRLVQVPPLVTAFAVSKVGLNRVTNLLHRWQFVAPNLEEDFYLSVFVGSSLPEARGEGISATFKGMYLGPRGAALESINRSFPELGPLSIQYKQMSWIESVVFFSGLNGENLPIDALRERYLSEKGFFKAKADFVRSPVPKSAIRGACRLLEQEPKGYVILDPYGGRMAQIAWDALPFPHRAGNLYDIQYLVSWTENSNPIAVDWYVSWLRRLYEYMTPYVSHSPRAGYVNYIDLDLGRIPLNGTWDVQTANAWGLKYFLGNFQRLVEVKSRFDPENVFRYPQSIPVGKLRAELLLCSSQEGHGYGYFGEYSSRFCACYE